MLHIQPKLKFKLIILGHLLFLSVQAQVKFVIESVPAGTPQNDSIFICGNFNNWLVNDTQFLLRKQLDGKYSVILPEDTGKVEYKFSRGSWMKVETDKDNEYLPNRVFQYGNGETVSIRIDNWQDLGGVKRLDYMVFFLFAAGLYGVILLLLIFREKRRDRVKTISLVLSNLILIAALFGEVLYNQTNLIWKSNIALLGHIGLTIWGPVMYFYFLIQQNLLLPQKIYRFFIPAFLVFIYSFLRILNFEPFEFLIQSTGSLSLGNMLSIAVGLLYTGGLFIVSRKIVFQSKVDKKETHPETELTKTIYLIQVAGYIILLLNLSLVGLGIPWLFVLNYDLVFVVLSFTILVEFYYLWRYPELIRDKNAPQFVLQNAEQLKEQLIGLMKVQKPYKNPELNIADLSDMLSTKPHVLSRLLNEVFKKSFRDFINEYRIDEFVILSRQKEYSNYTYLALAHEVGFNSKSTFNLAFKKHTKMSPRDYFKKSKL